jgi:hypothetical protein
MRGRLRLVARDLITWKLHTLDLLHREVGMSAFSAKEEARRLIDGLPDDATWEDIDYQIYVHHKIEQGLKDSLERRTIPHAEMERRFKLEPDTAFLNRISVARESIKAGRGTKLEDCKTDGEDLGETTCPP